MNRIGHAIIAATLALVAGIGSTASAYDHRQDTEALRQDFESGDRVALAVRTNKAIDALVRVAVRQLDKKGFNRDADRIAVEWSMRYDGALVKSVTMGDLGDHAALSGWMQIVYLLLEAKLGTPLMEILHLDDLNVLNLAIPVVFHMDIIDDAESIDGPEYGRHFEPFAGVLAYWTTWIGCEVATWGGGLFIICTPAGMAAEFVTVNWIAPHFSPMLWAKFYPENAGDDLTLSSCQCDCEGCDCDGCCGEDCDCPDCDCDECDDCGGDEHETADEVHSYGTESAYGPVLH